MNGEFCREIGKERKGWEKMGREREREKDSGKGRGGEGEVVTEGGRKKEEDRWETQCEKNFLRDFHRDLTPRKQSSLAKTLHLIILLTLCSK